MSSLAKNYNRKKIAFTKGKGSFLYSINGKKYLDFINNIFYIIIFGFLSSFILGSLGFIASLSPSGI